MPSIQASWLAGSTRSAPTSMTASSMTAASARRCRAATLPREQLGHRERLRDVVVRAFLERADLPPLGTVGGEHDDGAAIPPPEVLAHLDAVDVGQAKVEQHDVGLVQRRRCKGFAAGAPGACSIPASLERGADRVTQRGLVVDDEDLEVSRGRGG